MTSYDGITRLHEAEKSIPLGAQRHFRNFLLGTILCHLPEEILQHCLEQARKALEEMYPKFAAPEGVGPGAVAGAAAGAGGVAPSDGPPLSEKIDPYEVIS